MSSSLLVANLAKRLGDVDVRTHRMTLTQDLGDLGYKRSVFIRVNPWLRLLFDPTYSIGKNVNVPPSISGTINCL
jgi:hypothetical protein